MKKKLPASNLALCPLALKDAVLVIVAGHDIREGDDGMADSRVFHSLSSLQTPSPRGKTLVYFLKRGTYRSPA